MPGYRALPNHAAAQAENAPTPAPAPAPTSAQGNPLDSDSLASIFED